LFKKLTLSNSSDEFLREDEFDSVWFDSLSILWRLVKPHSKDSSSTSSILMSTTFLLVKLSTFWRLAEGFPAYLQTLFPSRASESFYLWLASSLPRESLNRLNEESVMIIEASFLLFYLL
jgi:hypothetical protein